MVIISYVAETDLDTIRASYVALNEGDVQAALDALHREAVWRESPELPGGDDFEGRGQSSSSSRVSSSSGTFFSSGWSRPFAAAIACS